MHFQQPGFLWGLLLIILPLIIHLFQFRKFKTVYFPGVSRLIEQLNASKKQKTVKHWWLLLTRILAVLFLVLAFAMPTCNSQLKSNGLDSKIIVVVDCSPSMLLQNNGEVILEKAKNAARRIINNANSSTKFAIIANHDQSEQQWLDARSALNAVSEIKGNNIPESLKTWSNNIQSLVSNNDGSQLFVYVVTDAKEDVFDGYKKIDYTAATWRIIEIASIEIANFSVDTAYYVNPWKAKNGASQLTAEISSSTKDFEGSLNVQIISDQKIIGSESVKFNGQRTIQVDFQIPETSKGNLIVKIEDNAIQVDNTLYVHSNSNEAFNIIQQGNNRYLNNVIRSQPIFKSENFSGIDKVTNQTNAVVFAEPEKVGFTGNNQIDNLTQKGITVVIAPTSNVKTFLKLLDFDGELVKSNLRLDANGLNSVEFKEAFVSEVDNKIQLPLITEYFKLNKELDPNWQPLLFLENTDPILLKKVTGNAAVYLWLSPLEQGSKAFAESSMFLPIFTQLFIGNQNEAKPICGFLNAQNALPISHSKEFDLEKGAELKIGQNKWVASLEMTDKGLAVNTNFPSNILGFYALYPSNESSWKEWIGLNALRTEKDLKSISAERKSELQELGVKFVEEEKLLNKITMIQADNSLWKLFLWIAALFFALEIILLVLKYQNKKSNLESNL